MSEVLEEVKVPAPFYGELHRILKEANRRRSYNEQISYRKAVVEGLGLRDSFTSKIKDGSYKPTIDRLHNLADLLGVAPTVFDSYVRRWGHEQVDGDEDFLEILRTVASQSESVQILLRRGMKAYLTNALDASRTKSLAVA